MTTTYTPDDLAYVDEGDLRVELGRVFDLCGHDQWIPSS